MLEDMGNMYNMINLYILQAKVIDMQHWEIIRNLEIKIIDAIWDLEAHEFFKDMHSSVSLSGFESHWRWFRDLPCQWDCDYEGEWDHPEKLLQGMDWKKDHKSLGSGIDKLKSAKPKGHEHTPEWTKDYRDQTHTSSTPSSTLGPPSTATVSENRNLTFGGAFRLLVKNLGQLVRLMEDWYEKSDKSDKSDNTWERIQNQKIVVKTALEKLSNNNQSIVFLKDMVAGLREWHSSFMNYWECLRLISSEWEESSSVDSITLAARINKEGWWKELEQLRKAHSRLRRGYPDKLKEDVEWKSDYKGNPSGGESDQICQTFGGAFRVLMSDLEKLERLTEGDCEDCTEIETLATRANKIVPCLRKHPLYEHMVLGNFETHQAFTYEWKKVENLSQEWEKSISTSKEKGTGVRDRNWKGDHPVLAKLQLESAKPQGFIGHSEWEVDYVPASRLMVRTLQTPKVESAKPSKVGWSSGSSAAFDVAINSLFW